jgi:hypothetical protein
MMTRDWWRTQMEVNIVSFYENRCNQEIVERWFNDGFNIQMPASNMFIAKRRQSVVYPYRDCLPFRESHWPNLQSAQQTSDSWTWWILLEHK